MLSIVDLNNYFMSPFATDNEPINDFILTLKDNHVLTIKVFKCSSVSDTDVIKAIRRLTSEVVAVVGILLVLLKVLHCQLLYIFFLVNFDNWYLLA